MQKMRELDQPVGEAAVQECGDMMGGMPPMAPQIPSKPDTPPPSMSVNLNAQGLDDIAELMKLMTKVNPDMINQPAPMAMPPISAEPSIMSIKPPMSGIGDLGNLDAGPLKMLPNLDMDEPHMEPDGDEGGPDLDDDGDGSNAIDTIQKSMGDDDGDSDKDSEEGDDESNDEEEKEAFGNAPEGASGQEYHGMDAAVPDGNDLNKSKSMHKHSYRQGDNPMAMPESKEQLRTSIKEELRRRLAETKSEKFDPLKHVKNPTKGEKTAAKDVKRGSYGDRAAMLKSAEADGRLKD